MKTYSCYFVMVSLLVLGGCNNAPTLKGLVPARGTITYNGAPLEEAAIMFSNANPGSGGQDGNTTSEAGGKFALWTVRPGDGIAPGEYNVSVTKRVPIHIPTPEENEAYEKKHGVPMPIEFEDKIPVKYGSTKTSEIKITIPKNGDKNIKIELADAN